MSDCGNYLGNQVVVGFDDTLAANADPTTGTYKPFGLTNSKSLSSSANTIVVTNDKTGPIDATLATGYAFELTVSGFAADADVTGAINQAYVKNFFHTRLNAGNQPKMWVEIVTPAETIYAYVMITGYTNAGASKEAVTGEFTMAATDTCDPAVAAVQYSYVAPV